MSTLFMDGFSHYGTGTDAIANMLDGVYAQVQTGFELSTPVWDNSGQLALTKNSAFAPVCRRALATTQTTMYWSLRFAIEALPSANNFVSVCDFRDNTNTIIGTLAVQSTGVLSIMDKLGNTGVVLAQTQGPEIVAQNFHFLEMFYDHNTAAFALRVDDPLATETLAIDSTGLAFGGNGVVAQVGFLCDGISGISVNPDAYIKDVFYRNSDAPNGSWIGDRRIATLFANEDTTTSGWTPSYYKKFGAGIARLSYLKASNTTVQNPSAFLSTAGVAALDIGSGDFTLETEVRFDGFHTTGYSTIFNRWDAAGNKRSYRLLLGTQAFNGGCLQFDTSTDGASGTVATKILYPWTPDRNVWYQIALCRSSGELLLFVNGEQLGLPITDGDTYFGGGNEVLAIGMETGTGGIITGSNLIGRLDETRFTNGYGRYTGPFSPPAAAFTRGSGDPHWAQVVLLMGYDSGIIDESSYVRTVSANGSAISFQPSDGPNVGVYSTVNKAIPDDNTFISAALVSATDILTMSSQPSDATTITVGTTDGSTPAVYRFKNTMAAAFDVLIDTNAQNTLINLYNAINNGPGSGTKYYAGTTINNDVTAVQLPVGQIEVVANIAGTSGNSIPATSTSTGAWATATLTGGVDIPGPTAFKLQRPPVNTTIISAMQMNFRGLKSDSGTASVQQTLVGPLGGTLPGAVHPLTTSVSLYPDIVETDPDTTNPITPTTIINGQFSINRTA